MNSPFCRDLMDELVVHIREAVDRKQENMRRRRRRDALRLQLVKVLENIAANCTFGIRYVLTDVLWKPFIFEYLILVKRRESSSILPFCILKTIVVVDRSSEKNYDLKRNFSTFIFAIKKSDNFSFTFWFTGNSIWENISHGPLYENVFASI